jgi:hypothetical protein
MPNPRLCRSREASVARSVAKARPGSSHAPYSALAKALDDRHSPGGQQKLCRGEPTDGVAALSHPRPPRVESRVERLLHLRRPSARR